MENTQNTNVKGKEKLAYEKPTIEVIELAETPQLLAGSPTPTTSRRDYDPTSW